jgi:hypothetical protein
MGGFVQHCREFLPASHKTPVITLHEGNTPLSKAWNLKKDAGIEVGRKPIGTGSALREIEDTIETKLETCSPR